MKLLTLLLLVPISIFAQKDRGRLDTNLVRVPITVFQPTDKELLQKKNKDRVDSLLKRVDKAATDIKQMQQEENIRHADSLIKVVDRLANRLINGNQALTDSAIVKAGDIKHYYIVIGVYANRKLAEQNKVYHKFNAADVVKSRGGKYYYLAIAFNDGAGIQKAVKKYMLENKRDAWWVRL
jgi:DNA uptake protein ComE-like DNA-binding protein